MLFIHAVYNRCYSLLFSCCAPCLYHVHVSLESRIIHAAEVVVWPAGLNRRCPGAATLTGQQPPAAIVHFPRRLLFCHPGVWASGKRTNLNPGRVHPPRPLIGCPILAWNVYGQLLDCDWSARLSITAVGRTRHFLP